MGVRNGSTRLAEEEEGQETSKQGFFSDHRRLTHYLSLLCLLLVIITLLQTLSLVHISMVFVSQSSSDRNKVTDLTDRLKKINQSYQQLFNQYPDLKLYCNSTSGDRVCSPCPSGWSSYSEKCFLFSSDRADWISSQYRCLTLGGAVATVSNEDEQEFLMRTAQTVSQGDSYWLGIRNAEEGWKWSDGRELKPQFWEREPEPSDKRELCGRLTPVENYRKSWFISRCSNQIKRICERKRAAL